MKKPLINVLVFLSFLACCFWVFRALATHSFGHAYLLWNLFLAWVPLLITIKAQKHQKTKHKVLILSILWLLFFPNAPYIITDLVHLQPNNANQFWHELILFFAFACVSLACGLLSMLQIQKIWAAFFSPKISLMLIALVIPLSAFGIYLGRIQRWNSWDAFLHPKTLIYRSIWAIFNSKTAWVITIEFSILIASAYLFFYYLTQNEQKNMDLD
jgi:uncharacterized membrane protein